MSLLLLDTHILIWLGEFEDRLSPAARLQIAAAAKVAFSVVSIWEVAIKAARPNFRVDPRRLRLRALDADFLEIGIRSEHAIVAGNLPPIHKDPFDRMLVAQMQVEGAVLLTADPVVARYPGQVVLA